MEEHVTRAWLHPDQLVDRCLSRRVHFRRGRIYYWTKYPCNRGGLDNYLFGIPGES